MRQLSFVSDLILTSRHDGEEAEYLFKKLCERGIVIGTDEAGRGALAGLVMAAAVYITPEQENELKKLKLRDSKLMTPKNREKIFEAMRELKIKWRAASSNIEMIERENILNASLNAMERCVELLARDFECEPACVIVDGDERINNLKFNQWPLIKADKLLTVVSAASVIAKVLRDRYMKNLDALYPEYHFAKNKGYPTRNHREAILKFGLSDVHRVSFCRRILQSKGGLYNEWPE